MDSLMPGMPKCSGGMGGMWKFPSRGSEFDAKKIMVIACCMCMSSRRSSALLRQWYIGEDQLRNVTLAVKVDSCVGRGKSYYGRVLSIIVVDDVATYDAVVCFLFVPT
jgi:hypothetical protein